METEIGMLTAILVAMNDTSDEDIQNFINGDEINGDTSINESMMRRKRTNPKIFMQCHCHPTGFIIWNI